MEGTVIATEKIIKRTVDALILARDPDFLWDDALKGFGVKILPSGRATYIIQYPGSHPRRTLSSEWLDRLSDRTGLKLVFQHEGVAVLVSDVSSLIVLPEENGVMVGTLDSSIIALCVVASKADLTCLTLVTDDRPGSPIRNTATPARLSAPHGAARYRGLGEPLDRSRRARPIHQMPGLST